MTELRRRLPSAWTGRACVVLGWLLGVVMSWPLLAAEARSNALGMTFVFVPPGDFRMGTSAADVEKVAQEMDMPVLDRFEDESPAHTVVISSGFWLQRTEVTQGQWLEVMGTRPGPADYWEHPRWRELPVVSVSWDMAQRFIAVLNEAGSGFRYRLPTEAEWEYAARAGSDALRPQPAHRLGEFAWFIDNSGDVPHPVATRKANGFGLYDTLGNAWEWVQDRYQPRTYTHGRRVDPQGPVIGKRRVRRGGSYHCPSWQTRPAYRAADLPDTAYSVIGLRLVAEISS